MNNNQANSPSYKLTKHSVGSLAEIWTISWPLILSLLSMSIMLFTDRLLLSRYSINALDAAASSGTAAYAFIVLPMAIAGISEVFVGRFHGENKKSFVGKPVWQMIWFSLFLIPIFYLVGKIMPTYLFYGSFLISDESSYFFYLMMFTPLFCVNAAIVGFFVGTGKVKTVTVSTFLSYTLNVVLDYLFIFGWGPIPEGGIIGAAVATGLSEMFNVLVLGTIMLSAKNKKKYETTKCSFDAQLFVDSLKVGFPSGLSATVQIIAHFIFFKSMSFAGSIELTIAAVVQSVFFLIMFLYDGLSKGVTAISANLLGASKYHEINKMIKSAFKLQFVFFLIVSITIMLFSHQIIDLFFNEADQKLIEYPHFYQKIQWCFFFMCTFFLFDGLARIFIGHLIAAGDTRYILYTSIFITLLAYIIPVMIAVNFFHGGALEGWLILAFFSINMLIVYAQRYRSKRWMLISKELKNTTTDHVLEG